MTTFAWPSVQPNSMEMGIVSNARVFRSPFSNAVQTAQRQGEYWKLRLSFTNLQGANRALVQAFLAQLNGPEHRFTITDYSLTQRGAFGGTPVVNGGSQTGNTLLVRGCTASVTNWARAGDQVQFGSQLVMVLQDANSDGGGNVSLSIRPQIRTSPADGTAVVTSSPVGLFMLAGPEVTWSSVPGIFSDITIDAVEDVLG